MTLSTNITLLGFDFGMKHIGVAVGQTITGTASPLIELKAQDGIPDWSQVEKLITKWRPAQLIVGIPLNMDGTEQPITFCARAFIKRLNTHFDLPVFEVDERLSSWAAKKQMHEREHKTKKNAPNIHCLSAVILLEQWMAEQA